MDVEFNFNFRVQDDTPANELQALFETLKTRLMQSALLEELVDSKLNRPPDLSQLEKQIEGFSDYLKDRKPPE